MLTRVLATIEMWCGLSALLVNLGASVSWSLIMSTITTAWTYWILDRLFETPKNTKKEESDR